MEKNRIWNIEQSQELTYQMDYIVQKALAHHQVQINMILVAELEGSEMTFNYNYIEHTVEVNFYKLLSYALKSFNQQLNTILNPELWVHISKISHWKYVVIHRDIDFWDVLSGQHTQRAVRTISNEFFLIFTPLQIQQKSAAILDFPNSKKTKVA